VSGQRFIGIDYSTTSCGIAIFDGDTLATHVVKSKPVPGGLSAYYARIYDQAMSVLKIIEPSPDDVIGIEKAIVMGRRTDTEVRLHYAWHRFVEYLHSWGVSAIADPLEIPPASVKELATGSGAAKKQQMVQATRDEFGICVSEDEADAVWVAVGASVLHGTPLITVTHIPKGFRR